MTLEVWIIAAVRIGASLPVLRWPFYGAVIAILVDFSDLFMMNLLDLGGVHNYQEFDKYLDQVYLLTFLVVARRWHGPARTVAVALYVFRLTGFVAFEVSGERDILLLFPNFFELWFLLVAGLYHFGRDPFPPPTAGAVRDPRLAAMPRAGIATAPGIAPAETAPRPVSPGAFRLLVAGLVALKLFQEYALHYGRWLDGFTAVEAAEAVWRFLTSPF